MAALCNERRATHPVATAEFARAPLDEVEHNIAVTSYPAELVTYCRGRVGIKTARPRAG